MAHAVDKELISRGNSYKCYPEDVVWDWKDNGRWGDADPAEIERKRASLDLHGQLTPVLFSLTPEKKVKLEAGFYRLLGMLEVNKTREPEKRMKLEGVIRDGNPEEMFLKNIAENRDRKDTSVVDDAYNVRRLSEQYGKSDEEICAIYGREVDQTGRVKPMSPAWLENIRKILRLPREIQAKIASGEIAATTGYALGDMDASKHKEVLDSAAEDGKPVTTTKVIKAARKSGAITGPVALRQTEEKSTWTYLSDKEKEKNPKVRKLAATIMLWRSGELPEPDFFSELHKLLA